MSRPRYTIVWSLKHQVPEGGWPLDKPNSLEMWKRDYYQQERDRMFSKRQIQSELGHAGYGAGRRRMA
jgi:hypothetical protein